MSDPSRAAIPAAGRAATPGPDIASSIARLGAYAWLSARLFEIVGAWVASTPDGAAKATFGELTATFAWQAQQWRDRLPQLREVSRSALMVSPGPEVDAALDELAALSETDVRLTGLGDVVLARYAGALAAHRAAADALRDGPMLRTARIIEADLDDVRRQLEQAGENVVTGATARDVSPQLLDPLITLLDRTEWLSG